jgi:hypothetical protein
MRLTMLIAAAAVLSVAATPTLAARVNPAAKLSPSEPAGEGTAKKARHGNGSTILLIGVGVAGVVGAAVALGHSGSKPASY